MAAGFSIEDRTWLEDYTIDSGGRLRNRREVEDEEDLRHALRDFNRRRRTCGQTIIGIVVVTAIVTGFAWIMSALIIS